MRSFKNKDGEKVEVTEDHLKTAIKIKKELQRLSPSGKASWVKLVRMMESEGFYDACNNESYRCMIKSHQKSIGELPEVAKHAEMVSDNKLQSIKEAVGEMAYAKRDAQNEYRNLSKLRREVIDTALFIEEVKSELSNLNFDNISFSYDRLEETENAMTVMMTDWHIGLRTSNYNYSIALDRVKSYAQKIIHYAKLFNITEVNVLGIGDLVEGGYLRPQQAFDIEFTYSEQIIKATEIVNAFLIMLSEELNVVYLGSVLGNHSRMYDKGATISGDSAENIVDATVKSFINLLGNKRISIDDKKVTNYDIVFELNNKKIKAVHGDLLRKSSNEKIVKFISSDNEFYDLLLYGHFHHTDYKEENHGRMSIGAGCLQGTTDYSKQLGYDTLPSQTIIILEGESIIPIRIVLV